MKSLHNVCLSIAPHVRVVHQRSSCDHRELGEPSSEQAVHPAARAQLALAASPAALRASTEFGCRSLAQPSKKTREALTLRAILHLQDNELGAADELLRRAKPSAQGVTGDGYMLWGGGALAQASQLPEALRAFTSARLERADGRYALGLARQQNGQLEEAIREYKVALGLDANHPIAGRARTLVQGR